jgi:hypothetical protein
LRYLAIVALATTVLAGGWPGYEWAQELARLPASAVDPALPEQKFQLWLDDNVVRHLPKDAVSEIRFEPCETDPEGCRMLAFDIVSRARRLVLTFDRKTHAFIGGTLGGSELERMPPITSLAELPGRLSAGIRPYPLDCPEGTTPRLEEEHAGQREWCEDAAGLKQGPARAWFSTGRYLMYRGVHVAGERDGRWIECNRFEQCAVRTYR